MLKRSVVAIALSLFVVASALASVFEPSRTGESHWSKSSAERIHCGANHAHRKARIAYENRESGLAKRSVVRYSGIHHGKSNGVRAQ